MEVGAVYVVGAVMVGGAHLVVRAWMKARDKEIEVERNRELEEEATQNRVRQPRTEPFQHFSHQHPLTDVNAESVPSDCTCGVCGQLVTGRGWAYRCPPCNYYLHEVCAKELVSLSLCAYSRAQEILAPADATTIKTFSHQEHPVTEIYSNMAYLCKHCLNTGLGPRFRCDACTVSLHPVCATCPTKISSFMHPQHPLELKTRRRFSVCDICMYKTESNIRLYRCKPCGFFVHPACSQLPQHLVHELHPPHPLQLRPSELSRQCAASCGSKCESGRWCYECKTCNVSIHIHCILRGTMSGTSDSNKEIYEIIQLLSLEVQNFLMGLNTVSHKCHD